LDANFLDANSPAVACDERSHLTAKSPSIMNLVELDAVASAVWHTPCYEALAELPAKTRR